MVFKIESCFQKPFTILFHTRLSLNLVFEDLAGIYPFAGVLAKAHLPDTIDIYSQTLASAQLRKFRSSDGSILQKFDY